MLRHRFELLLVLVLILLAAALRIEDIASLPTGFSNDELVYLRITEAARQGDVAVYYELEDGQGRAGGFALATSLATRLVGDGLLGYRLLPLVGGLLLVATTYVVGRRLFGPTVGVIAAGVLAVNFRAVLLARTVSAESWVPVYAALTLYAIVAALHVRDEVRFRAPETTTFTALALLLGGVGYLHFSLLLLPPVFVLLLAHLVLTGQPVSRRIWNTLVFVIVLATVTGMPYLVSTLRDARTSELYTLWSQRPDNLRNLIDGLLRMIGGLFWQGDPDPAHNLPAKPLLGPVVALLALLGTVRAARRWREPRHALLVSLLAGALLLDVWLETAPSFQVTMIALPVLAILAGVGAQVVVGWLRERELPRPGPRAAWQAVTLALLAVLALKTLVVRDWLVDDFRTDARVQAAYHADLGRLAIYLERTQSDPLPPSICIAGLKQPNAVGLTPPQMLEFMMITEDVTMRLSDCRSGMVFINAGTPQRFIFPDPADRELMPPELRDWLAMAVPLTDRGMPPKSVWYMDVEQRIQDAGGYWDARATAYYMPGEDGIIERVKLPIRLEENLTFAGYDPRVFADARRPGGEPIVLVSYWRVDGPIPPETIIFAHLLAHPNPQLAPLAEANSLDVFPTQLENRDIFAQVSYIWLSDQIQPGDYELMIGASRGDVALLENHLNVLDASWDFQPHGDRLRLGRIHVTTPEPSPEMAGPANGSPAAGSSPAAAPDSGPGSPGEAAEMPPVLPESPNSAGDAPGSTSFWDRLRDGATPALTTTPRPGG